MSGSQRVAVLAATLTVFSILYACGSDDSSPTRRSNETPDADTPTAPVADSGSPPVVVEDAGAPTTDPCAGRKVCDSFEGGSLGSAWKTRTNNGKVEVTTEKAFTGMHAVKFTTNQVSYQQAYIVNEGAPLFPLATNILYGRMMVWLDTPAAENVHWTMLSGDGPVANKSNVSAYYRYGGQPQGKYNLLANYDTKNANTDCWQHSETKMPIGKWTCFAWKLDGVSQELHIAMDGKPITDLDVIKKGQGCIANDLGGQWLAPTFSSTTLGWESYQADVGHTMYIDDVILDTSPVDCPVTP